MPSVLSTRISPLPYSGSTAASWFESVGEESSVNWPCAGVTDAGGNPDIE